MKISRTVSTSIKEQKLHRVVTPHNETPVPDPEVSPQQEKKRPMVQNTVERIEQGSKGFTVSGRNVQEVLQFTLAFLLNNGLQGQRHLHNSILDFFSWHQHLSLLLDWFHVVRKFREEPSLACKGRGISAITTPDPCWDCSGLVWSMRR